MRHMLLCLAAAGLLGACQERDAPDGPEGYPPHGGEPLHYRDVDQAHEQADEALRDLGAKPPDAPDAGSP